MAIAAVAVMAAISLALSLFNSVLPLVILFGLRTDFLHLPLIFIIPQVMDRDDVIRFGRWFMITSVPIFLLMAVQFNSKPTDWVNVGVGAEVGGQIRGALQKIRPPGPFSFISGVVLYFSLVAAFAVHGLTRPKTYPRPLLLLALVSTLLAVPISISRSLLMGIVVVAAFGGIAMLRDPRRLPRLFGALTAAVCLIGIMGNTVYVQAFMTRWDEAAHAGGKGFNSNVVGRMAESFTEPFAIAADTPLLGHGIGLGTVAGAHLMTGKNLFLLNESELARDVSELGPVLGFAFIAWRVWLVLYLIGKSWTVMDRRGDALPWLITGATFLNVLYGQWGPSTHLGFAVFGSGLALAAMNDPADGAPEEAKAGIRRG